MRATTRVGDLFVELLVDAGAGGRVDPRSVAAREETLAPETAEQLTVLAERRGYELPTGLLAATMDVYTRLHGFIAMEVFGQLRPITPDAGTWFEENLEDALHHLGLVDREHGVT